MEALDIEYETWSRKVREDALAHCPEIWTETYNTKTYVSAEAYAASGKRWAWGSGKQATESTRRKGQC